MNRKGQIAFAADSDDQMFLNRLFRWKSLNLN